MHKILILLLLVCGKSQAQQFYDPEVKPTSSKLFEVGESATCVYRAIYSWQNGEEYEKSVPLKCVVAKTSKPLDWPEFSNTFQYLKVNCSKALEAQWTSVKGSGIVKNHKLNYKEYWTSSRECYQF